MIGILNYGMGNLGSIKNMLKKIGANSEIIQDSSEISNYSKLILPGVGHFGRAMDNLQKKEFIAPIRESAERGVLLLGICLGMQLLADHSEEGDVNGLGLIPGQVEQLRLDERYKIPHMGWNFVHYENGCNLFRNFNQLKEARFYFVHTYHYVCQKSEHAVGRTDYGGAFTSVVRKANIWGTQFHPEKSHKFGMQLLRNFVEL